MTTIATEFKVIDDELTDAEGYVKYSGLGDIMDEVSYFSRMDDLVNALLDNEAIKVFWIDLNLDDGLYEEGGLIIIGEVRRKYPESLIIVYTAYGEMREECRKAGADHFFEKGIQFNETMETIRNTVTNFLNEKGLSVKVQKFIGWIGHIDEYQIKVECYKGGEKIEKAFPADLFKAAYNGKLRLDAQISVKAIQKNATISFAIEEIENGNEGADQKISKNSLLKSSIWFNKLK